MIADLCSVTLDGEHLAGVVSDVLYKTLATTDEVANVLGSHAVVYGFSGGNGREFLDYLQGFAS